MLNQDVTISILNNIRFQLDLKDCDMPALTFIKDTEVLSLWLKDLQENLSVSTTIAQKKIEMTLDTLANLIKEEDYKPSVCITDEEIKEIYFGIKSGKYDFIYTDNESGNAGGNREFIGSEFVAKATLERYGQLPTGKKYSEQYGNIPVRHVIESMIAKYKPADMNELRSLFRYVDKQ